MPSQRKIDDKTRDALEVDALCVAVGACENCPINTAMRRRAVDCVQFQERFPMEAVRIARQWKEGQNNVDADP